MPAATSSSTLSSSYNHLLQANAALFAAAATLLAAVAAQIPSPTEVWRKMDSSVNFQPLRAMISKLWSMVPASPPPSESAEGLREPMKWVTRCWSSKFFSRGGLLMLTMLLVSIVIIEFRTEVTPPWRVSGPLKSPSQASDKLSTAPDKLLGTPDTVSSPEDHCKEATHRYEKMGVNFLPKGIIEETTDLYMRALVDDPVKETQNLPSYQSLLTMPVGIKQKEMVNKIIEKFPEENFTVMLFHYDGKIDEWNTFPWSSRAIHVAAGNQTKWWFAKRFLHPDIVSSYKYIFIWDEDIGVEHFHATRYLEIVEREGLEISQPALDPEHSELHHQITMRRTPGKVHRRIFKFRGKGLCFKNSSKPPCTGWVEMMVPVFSRAAWQCTWYMIQNDLVHAWGLDKKLGYCAQGDPSKKVGIVDSQYIVHYGVPSLGGLSNDAESSGSNSSSADPSSLKVPTHAISQRAAVRRRSYVEQQIFRRRWKNATMMDECWQGQTDNV